MLKLSVELPYSPDDPLEQGGLLFGRGDHVMACTGPLPGDDRGTHHISLQDPGHVAAAEAAAERGMHYLGYWHSHPAGTPQTPSDVDIADFNKAGETLFPEIHALYFPIITGGVLRVFRLSQDFSIEEVPHELRPSTTQS